MNKYIINAFNILVEVFIGFSTFAIFFGILMIYFLTSYEVTLIGTFINQSISFYKYNKQYSDNQVQLKNIITTSSYIKNLEKNIHENEKLVNEHNTPYDNKLKYLILFMIAGLLVIILIPILFRVITLDNINFIYIGLSIILHIILIFGFELIFLLFIIIYINPVKLYKLFNTNYTNTGNYFGIKQI